MLREREKIHGQWRRDHGPWNFYFFSRKTKAVHTTAGRRRMEWFLRTSHWSLRHFHCPTLDWVPEVRWCIFEEQSMIWDKDQESRKQSIRGHSVFSTERCLLPGCCNSIDETADLQFLQRHPLASPNHLREGSMTFWMCSDSDNIYLCDENGEEKESIPQITLPCRDLSPFIVATWIFIHSWLKCIKGEEMA